MEVDAIRLRVGKFARVPSYKLKKDATRLGRATATRPIYDEAVIPKERIRRNAKTGYGTPHLQSALPPRADGKVSSIWGPSNRVARGHTLWYTGDPRVRQLQQLCTTLVLLLKLASIEILSTWRDVY